MIRGQNQTEPELNYSNKNETTMSQMTANI